jgi:hypothetical protein
MHGGAMITIERYGGTRFWAVYDADELVCVTVYKKGAIAVKGRLDANLGYAAFPERQSTAGRSCGKTKNTCSLLHFTLMVFRLVERKSLRSNALQNGRTLGNSRPL